MKRIYLDYAAGAPLEPEVKKVIDEVEKNYWANASSLHAEGRGARGVIDDARAKIARYLGADTDNIVFTSSATESNSLAMLGVLQHYRLNKGPAHLIVNRLEHPSIIDSVDQWQKMGLDVTWLSVDSDGLVNADELKSAIKDNTALVSVIYANNETGAVNDIAKLSEIISEKNPNTLFHTDAAQAVGWIDFKIKDLGVDLITGGSYKLGGPKGVGFLYISPRTKLLPVMPGTQEWGRRGGTEPTSLIAGLARAWELSRNWPREDVRKLRDYLIEKVLQIPDTICNTPLATSVPHIAHFSFADVDNQVLIIALDREGLAASPGSACSSGSVEVSHVVKGIGIDLKKYPASLRLSLNYKTTKAEADAAAEIIKKVIYNLRK